MSKKAKKKAKKEIIESAMQAVKAKVAAASNGEVKLKDGKDDEIHAMIASSAEAHGWASMMLTDEGAIGVASKPAPELNETEAARYDGS